MPITNAFDKVKASASRPYADAEFMKQTLAIIGLTRLYFFINQTDLLAPTNAQLVSPIKGKLNKLVVVIQVAVTTGGAITVLVGSTTVAGLSVTIADGATAGTILTDSTVTGDGTENVEVGSLIQIAPAAAIATAGAINGFVEITPTIGY